MRSKSGGLLKEIIMLENILVQRNVKTKTKITIKSLISVSLIVLAVALPQLVHLVAGAQGGMVWLPMYLPVLIGGLLLGKWWGLGVGILAPIVSFLFTSLLGNPMPALARLPFMIAELSVFSLVSGLFSKKISKHSWLAIPAVLLAILAGRLSFLGLVYIFEGVSTLSVNLIWSQILSSCPGILLQLILVPAIIILLNKILNREEK